MNVGRRIYYEILTGELIYVRGERINIKRALTIEEEVNAIAELKQRERDSFDVLELQFGQYAQDFAESISYRVNTDTKQIEFSYPNPNETEPSEPVYQAPLSEELNALKQENSLLKSKVDALASHNELMEGALIELTSMILG